MHTHYVCAYIHVTIREKGVLFKFKWYSTFKPLDNKRWGKFHCCSQAEQGVSLYRILNGHMLFALMSKKYNSSVNGHLIRTHQFSSAGILTLSPSLVLSPRFSSKLHTPFHLLVPSPPSWYYVLKLWILQVPRWIKRVCSVLQENRATCVLTVFYRQSLKLIINLINHLSIFSYTITLSILAQSYTVFFTLYQHNLIKHKNTSYYENNNHKYTYVYMILYW